MARDEQYINFIHKRLGELQVPHKMRLAIQRLVAGSVWFGKKFRKKKQLDLLKKFRGDILDPLEPLVLTPDARDVVMDSVLKAFMRGWGVELKDPVSIDDEVLAPIIRKILVAHKGSITEKIQEILGAVKSHTEEQDIG